MPTTELRPARTPSLAVLVAIDQAAAVTAPAAAVAGLSDEDHSSTPRSPGARACRSGTAQEG